MTSITATTTARCPCCSLPNTLECRVRSGTASLCGHEEFASPSTPPKKYRVKTASGSLRACQWDGATCGAGTQQGADRLDYSGTCTYDSSTCSTTNSMTVSVYSQAGVIGCPGSPTFSSNSSLACNATFTPAAHYDDSINSTSYTQTQNGTNFMSGGYLRCPVPGDFRKYELTIEDTEADAIARLQAATSFGSWIASGGIGCAGTPPPCCLAKYQSRTTGFDIAYADAEARVTATGLSPSVGYTAKIELYRRPYGSGSFAHYQTATVTGVSDGSGNLTTTTATVTNTKGYETYAATSSLFNS